MKKKVKLSFPPEKWNIEKHSPSGSCVWGDYEFFLNNDDIQEYDYWFIVGDINNTTEKAIVPPNNVILDAEENPLIMNYKAFYLDQFAYVSSYRVDIKHKGFIRSTPVIPWFYEKNFDELIVPERRAKTKKISILTSSKKITVEHIKRLNFIKKLHNYFGDNIDIYGDGYSGYVAEKKSILEDYEFSIALENFVCKDYVSEKFTDCLLGEAFPIYHGCPNVTDYFDQKSFQRIDMYDFEHSVGVIKNVLESENLYKDNYEILLKSKLKYLNNYSIFPVMSKILDEVTKRNKGNVEERQLVTLSKLEKPTLINKIKNKLVVKTYDLLYKN